MSEFQRLLSKQLVTISCINQVLPKYKKLPQARRTGELIRRRIQQLAEYETTLNDLHSQILITRGEEDKHPYFEEDQYEKAREVIEEATDHLHEVLVSLAPIMPNSEPVSQPSDYIPRSLVKLPPIDIEKFDGNYAKWETFRDRFSSLIINDTRLNDCHRMHYLNSFLTGEANNAVSHLSATNDAFESAWMVLTTRYDDKRRILATHIDTLLLHPPVTPKSAKSLRSFRETFNITIQLLRNLGRNVEGWDDLLVHLACKKLDARTREAWEEEVVKKTQLPTYKELDAFLQNRAKILEASMLSVEAQPASQPRQTASKKVSSHTIAVTKKSNCHICREDHPLHQCSTFRSHSLERRLKFIHSQNRCVNCLSKNHNVQSCTSLYRCRDCNGKHHTLLHKTPTTRERDEKTVATIDNSKPQAEVNALMTRRDSWTIPSVILATARVKAYSPSGRAVTVRALLDQGSEATLISENLSQLLRLPRNKHFTRVNGIGATQTISKHIARIGIGPSFREAPSHHTTAIVLASLTKFTPRNATKTEWSHTNNLLLADSSPASADPIEMVIGADVYGSVLLDGILKGGRDEPIAQNTIFGWILSGRVSSQPLRTVVTNLCILDQLDQDIRRFWDIEDVPQSRSLSIDEQECEEHFKSTHSRNHEGRYIVRLPFKAGTTQDFGESREIACRHLNRLQRRLHKNSEEAVAYSNFLKEYESLGHMDKLSAKTIDLSTKIYYIPHHAVFRPESTTTRLRVVFNASQPTTKGTSLNEQLHAGPRLQVELPAILLRWRQHKFVLTSDIAKMFRQIIVDERDRDYQRILWRPIPSDEINEYRLNTVTYGTTSAPFLAIRVLHQLSKDEGSQYPLAVPILEQQTYVDDCIFGAEDIREALEKRDQLIDLLAKGGFQLRKWATNHSDLLANIDPADHGLAQKDFFSGEYHKILGIAWDPDQDTFRFRASASFQGSWTKRTVLSETAKLFDPMGWITPVTIFAKIFIQRLWELKATWDETLPRELSVEWSHFYARLSTLSSLSLSRWTGFYSHVPQWELHGFADASTKAYAAVLYSRMVTSSGEVKISLLMAKSKVAPLKTISVPRLELCAALLLTKLIEFVRTSLQFNYHIHCWTDSAIVLEWLRQSPSRWKTFVANRVSRIQQLGPHVTWRHVATQDNPADCASRGIQPEELSTHPLWWTGPSWLSEPPDRWPSVSQLIPQDNDLETRKIVVNASQIVQPWDLASRFSSWAKLLRVTSYVLRFIDRVRGQSPPHLNSGAQYVTVPELRRAKFFWLKWIQLQSFPSEYDSLLHSRPLPRTSSIITLTPYLDEKGIIRVTGRLQNSEIPVARQHPIILKSHYLVNLIVIEAHHRLLHGGTQLTLAALRDEYWILRARQLVRSVLYRCLPCTRQRAQIPTQLMGNLPKCRVNRESRAFVHTGIDYGGPFAVRKAPGRGNKTFKAYVALFICMTTRAIHIELVSDYSASAFVAAYNRFVSRRGLPAHMYSDNGTTFRGAERELSHAYRTAVRDNDFLSQQAHKGVTWHFIPPSAPHFGGLWEAAIKSIKHHLRRCTGSHHLTFEEMTTLLCRIEACLNSRPIAALTDHLDDFQCLTPGHFLIGAPLVSNPEPSTLDLREGRLSRWQVVQRISEHFWKAWSHDYLHTLQQRSKWHTENHSIRPGALVLIRTTGLPASHWALGRLTACHPGQDGLVRVVTVRTGTSDIKRPISKICLLPVDINSANECDKSDVIGNSSSKDNTVTY